MLPSDDRPRRILLIDASPYIFRSYFALPSSITTPTGHPANASNGFASFLIKLLAEEKPSHVGVAFDGSLTTSFRNEIYPAYKANRDLPPDALVRQLEDCRELASALGLLTDISDRYEADDLIGSWVDQVDWAFPTGEQQPSQATASIVSSDKDLGQLVSDDTDLYDFAKGLRLNAAEIEAKFGVPPANVIDFLALAGDAVDNIPGLKGVGPKTAVALLHEFSSVHEILRDPSRVEQLPLRGAKSLARKLKEQEDTVRLSYQLASIALDAPVASDRNRFRWNGPTDAWQDVCNTLGFTSLRDRGEALTAPLV